MQSTKLKTSVIEVTLEELFFKNPLRRQVAINGETVTVNIQQSPLPLEGGYFTQFNNESVYILLKLKDPDYFYDNKSIHTNRVVGTTFKYVDNTDIYVDPQRVEGGKIVLKQSGLEGKPLVIHVKPENTKEQVKQDYKENMEIGASLAEFERLLRDKEQYLGEMYSIINSK